MALFEILQNSEIVCCRPQATLEEVAVLMREHGIGSVVVAEEHHPVGIVTDRDLVVRGIYNGHDCATTPVRKVMSSPVQTLYYDAGIHDVIEKMKVKGVSHICILDGAGKAIGVISAGDIFELLSHEIDELCEATGPHNAKLIAKSESGVAPS